MSLFGSVDFMNNRAKTYLWENARLFYLLLYSISLRTLGLSPLKLVCTLEKVLSASLFNRTYKHFTLTPLISSATMVREVCSKVRRSVSR